MRNGEQTMNILGRAEVTIQDAVAWARRKGATDEFISLTNIYWDTVAASTGCRPEVLFAQAAKETGFGKFGGIINASFKNPCGLKTKQGGSDSDPNAHQRFPDWLTGCMAHGDHLALYAGQKNYPRANTPDPRHFPFLHNRARNSVEGLSTWASDDDYGIDLAAMVREMPVTAPAPAPTPTPAPAPSAAPPLVARAQWGARAPRSRTPLAPTGFRFHYSGSGADELADHRNCALRWKGIQNYHMDGNGWADLAYSQGYCKHGAIFEGRGWTTRTAANGTNECNGCCLAFCFLGDDSAGRDDVTDAGRAAGAWLAREAIRRGATQAGGHRDCLATTCPGDEIYGWVKAKGWGTAPAPAPVPQPAPKPPGVHSHGMCLIQLGARDPIRCPDDGPTSQRALVKDAQTHLNNKGARDFAGRRLVIDGDFGPSTEQAVKAFQSMKKIGVDGIVGTGQTWPALHAK